MNQEVKVSVVIPCYNYGEYIDRAVDSVLKQTYQNFEIIIVNDGSTDEKTNKKLANYDKPKTKVIQASHQGPSTARNTAIEAAKGEYILPLDTDDTIDPTYLEKAVKILDENEKVSIVYCNWKTITGFCGIKRIRFCRSNYKFPECLLFRTNHIFTVTSFFRKADWEKVGGFNPNMKKGLEDYNFWLSIIELGGEIYHLDEFLFNYYRNPKARDGSMTIEEQQNSYAQIFENHKKMYLDHSEIILKHSVELTLKNMKYQMLNKRLIFLLLVTYGSLFLILLVIIFKAVL